MNAHEYEDGALASCLSAGIRPVYLLRLRHATQAEGRDERPEELVEPILPKETIHANLTSREKRITLEGDLRASQAVRVRWEARPKARDTERIYLIPNSYLEPYSDPMRWVAARHFDPPEWLKMEFWKAVISLRSKLPEDLPLDQLQSPLEPVGSWSSDGDSGEVWHMKDASQVRTAAAILLMRVITGTGS